MLTISEMLNTIKDKNPHKDFIIYKDEKLTYKEMDVQASKLANVLRSYDIVKGDAVGLYLPSCIELAIGYYACQKIGAVAVPMNSMYRLNEVKQIVKLTDMTFIITNKENHHIVDSVKETSTFLKHVMIIRDLKEGCLSFEKEMKRAKTELSDIKIDINDPAVVFFTSGTTGKPKGAVQTHKSIYSAVQSMNSFWKFRYGKEIILTVLPIFNNFGATVNMNGTLLSGGTMILHERWDTEKVLKTISEENVTFFAGAPTMFQYLVENYDPEIYDLSSLKICLSGGASMPTDLLSRVKDILKTELIQIYGATETSGAITAEPIAGLNKKGSVGIPIGNAEITIIDDEGNQLGQGEIGEIVINGDAVGPGYWKNEQESSKAFKDEGWYSGDIGYLDEDGYLYIIDRKTDVIITGGNNVYPIEVEEVLHSIEEISLASVIGIPDEVKGEEMLAYVKLKDNETILAKEIIHYCRERLAAYKVPKKIEFVDHMPLGPTGKILKKELRKIAIKEKE